MGATLDAVSGSVRREGNSVTAFVDGENVFPPLLADLQNAKRSITYEAFEVDPDSRTTEAIADALIAAHARGVDVRVLVDAAGSHELLWMHNATVTRLRQAGVDVVLYEPLDSLEDLDLHRDHRKGIVVDGELAWVGGMNTGDRYFGGPEIPSRLHDVFARTEGPCVRDMALAFADSWSAAHGSRLPDAIAAPEPQPPRAAGVPLRLVTHVPGRDTFIRNTYLALIEHAKTRINLENSYPLTDELAQALRRAAQRGVEVNYIVSRQGFTSIPASKHFQPLLDAGVKLFIYPTPLHTKSISVDGEVAAFGSSNVDNVSLIRNRELFAVVEDAAFTRDYDARLFDRDRVSNSAGQKTLAVQGSLHDSFWAELSQRLIESLWPDSLE